jgi:hypothetical protein
MPNAKEVFFMGFFGFTHPPAPEENEVKNTSFLLFVGIFESLCEGGASPRPRNYSQIITTQYDL